MKLFKQNRLCGWIVAASVLLRACEIVEVLAGTEPWNDEATPHEASDSNSRGLQPVPVSDGVQGGGFGAYDSNETEKKPLSTGDFHLRASARRLQHLSDGVHGGTFVTDDTNDPETHAAPYEAPDAKAERGSGHQDPSVAARRLGPGMSVVSRTRLPHLAEYPPREVHIHVQGHFAYLGCYFSKKVLIYDISDPAAPRYVASVDTCSTLHGNFIVDIWVSGTNLWTAHRRGEITMVDISDPANPVTPPECFSETYCRKGLISSHPSNHGSYLFYSGRSLSMYSIWHEPPSLRLEYRSPPVKPSGADEVILSRYNEYLYWLTRKGPVDATVDIYKINYPTYTYEKPNITLVGKLSPPSGTTPPHEMILGYHDRIYGIALNATGRGEGFVIYDAARGEKDTNPEILGRVSNHPLAYRMALDDDGEVLYVGDHDGSAKISAYDVRDPTSPRLIDSYDLPPATYELGYGGSLYQMGGLWYHNAHVYTVNGDDLVILGSSHSPPDPFAKYSGSLPYPVLFIHGWGADKRFWKGHDVRGFGVYFKPDTGSIPDHVAREFEAYPYLNYANRATAERPSSERDGYKYNGMEFFESSDPRMDVVSMALELSDKIVDVLDKYYGVGRWRSIQNAKIICVAHSQGGLALRWAIHSAMATDLGNPLNHIDHIITIGTPHLGTSMILETSGIKGLDDMKAIIAQKKKVEMKGDATWGIFKMEGKADYIFGIYKVKVKRFGITWNTIEYDASKYKENVMKLLEIGGPDLAMGSSLVKEMQSHYPSNTFTGKKIPLSALYSHVGDYFLERIFLEFKRAIRKENVDSASDWGAGNEVGEIIDEMFGDIMPYVKQFDKDWSAHSDLVVDVNSQIGSGLFDSSRDPFRAINIGTALHADHRSPLSNELLPGQNSLAQKEVANAIRYPPR